MKQSGKKINQYNEGIGKRCSVNFRVFTKRCDREVGFGVPGTTNFILSPEDPTLFLGIFDQKS